MHDMIDLDTERMIGGGDALRDGMKCNKLFGLNDLCLKYVDKSRSLLELGCNECVSTRLFCHYAEDVTGVDIRHSQGAEITKANYNNFSFINATFESFFKKNKHLYDIVYIDGDHSYNSVVRDIKMCLDHIVPGGIICGHDYHNASFTDVPRAVSDCFAGLSQKPEVFSDSSWLINLP